MLQRKRFSLTQMQDKSWFMQHEYLENLIGKVIFSEQRRLINKVKRYSICGYTLSTIMLVGRNNP